MKTLTLPQYPDLTLKAQEYRDGFMLIAVYVKGKPYIGPAFKLCMDRDDNVVEVTQHWNPQIGTFYISDKGKNTKMTLEYVAGVFFQVAALQNNFVDAIHSS